MSVNYCVKFSQNLCCIITMIWRTLISFIQQMIFRFFITLKSDTSPVVDTHAVSIGWGYKVNKLLENFLFTSAEKDRELNKKWTQCHHNSQYTIIPSGAEVSHLTVECGTKIHQRRGERWWKRECGMRDEIEYVRSCAIRRFFNLSESFVRMSVTIWKFVYNVLVKLHYWSIYAGEPKRCVAFKKRYSPIVTSPPCSGYFCAVEKWIRIFYIDNVVFRYRKRSGRAGLTGKDSGYL